MQTVLRLAPATILIALLAGAPEAIGAQAGTALPGARYFAAGQELLARGETVAGLEALTVAVVLAPDDVARQAYLLARLDRAEYNWDVGLHEALHAVAPAYPPLIQRLAKLYEGKGRAADAEALYATWARLRPDQPEPWARLGEHYFFNGRYAEAIDAFSRHRTLVGETDYAERRIAAARKALAEQRMHAGTGMAAPPSAGVRVAEQK